MRIALPALLFVSLLACKSDEDRIGLDDSALPDYGGRCVYTTSELALGDTEPLGFAVASVVEAVAFVHETTLKWDLTSETTPLTFELVPEAGPATLHTGVWEVPDDRPDDFAEEPQTCEPFADFAATMRMITEDGRLDEALVVRVVANAAGVGRVDHEVDAAVLQGSGPLFEETPTEWDELRFAFAVNVSAGTTEGEIAVSASRTIVPEEGDSDEDGDVPTEGEGMVGDVARWPWPRPGE